MFQTVCPPARSPLWGGTVKQFCIEALATPATGVIWSRPATLTRNDWTWHRYLQTGSGQQALPDPVLVKSDTKYTHAGQPRRLWLILRGLGPSVTASVKRLCHSPPEPLWPMQYILMGSRGKPDVATRLSYVTEWILTLFIWTYLTRNATVFSNPYTRNVTACRTSNTGRYAKRGGEWLVKWPTAH